MTRFYDRTKRIRELRIAVMDEISAALKEAEAPLVHGDIPGYLLHPGFIGMLCDPGDLNATTLEMDKEKHIVSNQPTQCQYLNREKVGTCRYLGQTTISTINQNVVFP